MVQLHSRREFIRISAAGALLAGFGKNAFSQAIETARIVNGFPAGSTLDVLARKVGDLLIKSNYARNTIVENKTGAGGQLAVTAMKGLPSDGSSILLTPMSMLCIYPHTYSKLAYDPFTDLIPAGMAITHDYAIGVGPAVPENIKTINDLLVWFKANPSKANIASPATGSSLHFVGQTIGRAAGVPITHIGYRGSQPAVQEMLGGQLSALCGPVGAFLPLLKEAKIRVLATAGAQRSRFMPEVRTLAEQGFKDLVYHEWYGFFLPAKASAETVKRFNLALQDVLKASEMAPTLASLGMDAAYSTPEKLAEELRADYKRWGDVVKAIGFKADS